MALISIEYNTYISDIISLVKSIVLKSVQTINTMNSYLTLAGDVLSTNPSDWKYYKNLAGIPYVGSSGNNNDPIITIISLDTGLTIPFTPLSLANNPITFSDLSTYGASYQNILARYPTQGMLIRGIISPIDINTAINANDYQILNYDASYLGTAETTLINDLQVWINNYASRWDLPLYSLADNLFYASNLGILYLNMVPAIINIRLKNCKTPQAHDFHIWKFLGGYFNLDKYQNIIPFQQAQFLYRNIEYIVANAGKSEVLDFLNTNFVIPFGLTLTNFDIRKDIGNSLSNLNSGLLTNLNQNVIITEYEYGTSNNTTENTPLIKVNDFVNKLIPLAPLNINYVSNDISTLNTTVSTTRAMEIPTATIEGNIKPSVLYGLVDVINEKYHYFIYLASKNYIKYKYQLSIPSENINNVLIKPGDAVALLYYASGLYFNDPTFLANKSIVPTIQVRDIMTNPLSPPVSLTEGQVIGVIENKFLFGTLLGTNITWNRFNDISASQIYPTNILNINDYNNFLNKVINSKIQHFLELGLEVDAVGRDELLFLINIFYQNYNCTYIPETSFPAFFTRIGFSLDTFSNTSLLILMNELALAFMNITTESGNTLQSPYSDMVDILSTVSSYMLQFIKGSATNDITPLDPNYAQPSFFNEQLISPTFFIEPGLNDISYIPLTHNITDSIALDLTHDISVSDFIADAILEIELITPIINSDYEDLIINSYIGSTFTLQ